MQMRQKLTFANVLSLIAVFIALGGTAIATTALLGSSGTRVRACVRNGDLRVLGRSDHCRANERPISLQRWQKQAPGQTQVRPYAQLVAPSQKPVDQYPQFSPVLWESNSPPIESDPDWLVAGSGHFIRFPTGGIYSAALSLNLVLQSPGTEQADVRMVLVSADGTQHDISAAHISALLSSDHPDQDLANSLLLDVQEGDSLEVLWRGGGVVETSTHSHMSLERISP
jgi:hypothetical protein